MPVVECEGGIRFNSRARVGRDLHEDGTQTDEAVSIHAPAWGATNTLKLDAAEVKFQFTRPRGARQTTWQRKTTGTGFNSRARVGRDKMPVVECEGGSSFNSRARVGRDSTRCCADFIMLFQFTRPRGARRSRRARGRRNSCFNSRARVGRDTISADNQRELHWFQFTRPRGARQESPAHGILPERVSIHAPAWGATYLCLSLSRLAGVSIHAPAWGATPYRQAAQARRRSFNSRARVGRDVPDSSTALDLAVSIHAPAWGATSNATSPTNTIGFQFTRPRGARLQPCLQ